MFSEEFLIIMFERNRGSFVPRAPLGKANKNLICLLSMNIMFMPYQPLALGFLLVNSGARKDFFPPFLNHSLAAWRE